jgi:hypothetical protein
MQHRKSYGQTTGNDELNRKRLCLIQETGETVLAHSAEVDMRSEIKPGERQNLINESRLQVTRNESTCIWQTISIPTEEIKFMTFDIHWIFVILSINETEVNKQHSGRKNNTIILTDGHWQ